MSVSRTGKPRLQIAHLFGWITGVSVVLAAFYWVRQINPESSANTAQRLRELAVSLSYGAGICGGAIVSARWLSGGERAGEYQPGHWMLVILGAAGIVDGLVLLVGTWLKMHVSTFASGNGMYWLWIAQVASAMIVAAVGAEIAFNPRRGAARSWRAFSLAVAVLLAMQATWLFTSWVTYNTWKLPAVIANTAPFVAACGIPVVLAFLAWAMLDDRRQRRSRDWLHYAGIGASVAFAATYWTADVWSRFTS